MNQGLARIVTAVIGIPLVLGAIYYGSWLFFGFVVLIALVGQVEFVYLLRRSGWHASAFWSLLVGLAWFAQYLVDWWQAALIVVLLMFGASILYTGVFRSLERFSGTIAALVYPAIMVGFLIDIRWKANEVLGSQDAFWLVLMLFCLIWATDTGAYYTGRSMGKHKLAPSVSPNKTWEGTLGGVFFAIAAAAIFKTQLLPQLTWMDVGILSLLGGVWGQLGDLLESAFKRAAGVKDSASILPGHGGILDRFDSIIFTVPAYYLYLLHFTPFLGG